MHTDICIYLLNSTIYYQKDTIMTTPKILDVENETFLSVEEVAEILNCSKNNIYNHIRANKFPAVRYIGSIRVPKSMLNEWINEQIIKPDKP